jgi:hypothetical protein
MIYPNEIIGSLVYRTREALNKNSAFRQGLNGYPLQPSITDSEGNVNFWHYAGTFAEISEKYLNMADFASCRVKFPAVFNYQAVRETTDKDGTVTLEYNLVFVTAVKPEWQTETRTDKVWKPVLSPIYEEFMRQVKRSGFFALNPGGIPHTLYRIPTTGRSITENVRLIYADYMDAYQLSGLRLKVRNICEKDLLLIASENKKVVEQLN